MDVEMISGFCWFVAGAAAYSIGTLLLNISRAHKVYSVLESSIFTLLYGLDIEVKIANRIKYDSLRASGMPNEIVEKVKFLDQQKIEDWRSVTLLFILTSFPKSFSRFVNYSTWQKAIKHVKIREVNDDD